MVKRAYRADVLKLVRVQAGYTLREAAKKAGMPYGEALGLERGDYNHGNDKPQKVVATLKIVKQYIGPLGVTELWFMGLSSALPDPIPRDRWVAAWLSFAAKKTGVAKLIGHAAGKN